MMPIGDDNSDMRMVPGVNYVLIGLNVLVFVFLPWWQERRARQAGSQTATPSRNARVLTIVVSVLAVHHLDAGGSRE